MSMRVTLRQRRTGLAHFPGLAKPFILDTAMMPEPDAAELVGLIEHARFFELPAVVGGGSASARDEMAYEIMVEANGRQHTVNAADPVPSLLEPLITYLIRARKKFLRNDQS